MDNSNKRFAAQAMDQRAEAQLRKHSARPETCPGVFPIAPGPQDRRRRVAGHAPRPTGENAQGLPKLEADATRSLIIGHLAQALPAREAGAEVSLAIAGVAADSLSQMIPGLLGGGQAQGMLNGQRERLMQQIDKDLNNTLLYVYRDLSDPELEEFATLPSRRRVRRITRPPLPPFAQGLPLVRAPQA